MDENSITPAINQQLEGLPNEMSAADFQRRLYAWFEDRGLLSDLRAHLRRHMINILKDTTIGRTTASQKHVSPKLQAVNLLIAEFLLQQEYHYSLSVFSTEVPLVNVLPEFPGLMMNRSNDEKKWRFSEKDMWDILETLGIQRNTDEGKNIHTAYYIDKNKEPLLTCIVRMLHSITNKAQVVVAEKEDEKFYDANISWIKKVANLLSANNVTNSEEVISILTHIIDSEKQRLKEEAQEDYLKLQVALQLQTAKREEEYKRRIEELQKSFEIEKEKLSSEKSKCQVKAEELQHKMMRHQSMLRDRYQSLITRERDVSEREQFLVQKEDDLGKQQHNLEVGFEKLFREQQSLSDLHQEIKDNRSESLLRNTEEQSRNLNNQIASTEDVSFEPAEEDDQEQVLTHQIINQLRIENRGLRTLNSEQQFRIEQLSQRASQLMLELETSRATNHHNLRNGVLSAPPLTAPTSASSSNSGAGEEGYRPTLSTTTRNIPARDNRRRMPPRRLVVHSSSSDDHSPSSDILQEARERLRQLEKESEEVDRNYRLFKSKQTQKEHLLEQKNRERFRNLQKFLSNGESSQNVDKGSSSSNVTPRIPEPQPSTSNGIKDDFTSDLGLGRDNIDLAQLVEWHFRQAVACSMASEHDKLYNRKPDGAEGQRGSPDSQSIASSGVLSGMLAGTSGISFLDIDGSDEKSESQVQNERD